MKTQDGPVSENHAVVTLDDNRRLSFSEVGEFRVGDVEAKRLCCAHGGVFDECLVVEAPDPGLDDMGRRRGAVGLVPSGREFRERELRLLAG